MPDLIDLKLSVSDKNLEIAIERTMADIEHTRHDMAESQRRIERLRGETSTLFDETRAVLNQLATVQLAVPQFIMWEKNL